MNKRQAAFAVVVCGGLALAIGGCQASPSAGVEPQAPAPATPAMTGGEVPIYAWDPYWPKLPLPNNWAVGNVPGLDVDDQDNVWIVQRPRTLLHGHEDDASYPVPESECCVPAPSVIEFSPQGDVVTAWGGPARDPEFVWPNYEGESSNARKTVGEAAGTAANPSSPNQSSDQTTKTYAGPKLGFKWPESEHTIHIDAKGFVWVGNNGGSHIIKMTKDGKFVLQVGRAGVPVKERNSNVTDALNSPAGVTTDLTANEVYVADGYGNRRVIVFDSETGAYKRHWGAYGKRPDDSIRSRAMPFVWKPTDPKPAAFSVAHSVRLDKDGLVYVGDRNNSRIQVFKKDGTFIKEAFIAPNTVRGSVLDFVFSKDPGQTFVFVADGRNERVWILRRSDLRVIGEFGFASHWGGGFTIIHNIAVDSKNNIYTSESLEGKRVQRFLFKGMGPKQHEYDENGMRIK